MAQQIINYGNTANDGTGDPLRDAFIKVDDNFNQIWAAGPVGSNITIQNNTIAVTDTNGNLILSPNGVGIIQTNRHQYPRLNNTYDLGSESLRYRNIFVGSGGIDVSGNLVLANIANLQIPGGQNGYVIQTDGNSNLSWVAMPGMGNGSPGGANGQVQFNSNGLFGGDTNFAFDYTTSNLTVGNSTVGNISTTSLYAGNTVWSNTLLVNRVGSQWSIEGNAITSPGGGQWVSDAGNSIESFSSATNGFLDLATYDAVDNLASQVHLEHGLIQINIIDGTNYTWQFNNNGVFSAPGNISANYFLGNGSQLTDLPGGVIQGNVPPPNPNDTTLWWDDVTGRLYIWYTDQDGSQWVDASPAGPAVTYGNANVSTYLASGTNTAGISTIGNVTANFLLGDGSQLSNIPVNIGTKIVNGTSYANIADTNGNLEINVNSNSWTFDTTGNLTVPLNTNFNTPNVPYADINFHVAQGGVVKIQGGSGGLGPLLVLQSDEINSLNRIEIDTFGNTGLLGGTFLGSFSRGEPGNYQAVQAGDRLSGLRGRGYDGSSFITTGLISIDAFDNWAVGNTPTKISFWNDGYGNVDPILNMEINPDGNVNIFNGNIIVTGGGGYLQGNVNTGSGGIYAGIPGFTQLGSEVVAQFAGNVNNYSQINFQNVSDGIQASGDIIITANNGDDSNYFIDLGIAGNTWDGSQQNSLGNALLPNDGYLYVNSGNLIVGTSITNGATKTWKFDTTGSLTGPGNITGSTFISTPVVLANLTAVAGSRAFITDGNLIAAGNFGAQVGGGGANTVPVWSDGTNWYIG